MHSRHCCQHNERCHQNKHCDHLGDIHCHQDKHYIGCLADFNFWRFQMVRR